MPIRDRRIDRRALMLGAAGLAIAGWSRPARTQADEVVLRAAPAARPDLGPAARLDLYGGTLPGPVLRFRQGEPAAFSLENGLDRPARLYLQGVRGANPIDGGFGEAVPTGGTKRFAFTPKDAGTYLYRPETGRATAAEVEAGLAGVLVVEPAAGPAVREHVLALTAIASERIDPAAGAGAIGWLANGLPVADLAVAPGEKLLLRLANLAAAFPVEVTLPCPAVVQGVDGQPSDPLESVAGTFLLGPFGRLDFALAVPDARDPLPILVDAGSGPRPMARLVFEAGPFAGSAPLPANNPLPAALPLRNAVRAELVVADADTKAAKGRTILGRDGAFPPAGPACLTAPIGRAVVLTLVNRTMADYSFHWHGFPARLLDTMDDGWKPWWIDSVLVPPGATMRVAFLADTPGRWLVSAQRIGARDDRRFTWFQVR